MKYFGVMMDASGIQKYIFGTNRLAQNVGASRIVEKILEEAYLAQCLDNAVSEEDLKIWRENPQDISMLETKGFLLAYTGGGNALMVFTEEKNAVDFAKNWTFNVIQDYPGLKPITGIGCGDFDPKDFKTFRNKCWRALQREKSLNTPVLDLPRHGVTAECVFTGEAAETRDVPGGYFENEKKYISNVVTQKEKNSQAFLKRCHDYGYDSSKEIPLEFEDLGGKSGDANKTLMAVVHVDGNNMGRRFEHIKSLEDYRKTSVQVNSYVQEAFKRLVEDFRKIQRDHKDQLFETDNKILIRPIILGGDDVTFVCYGLLGLWAAEKFIHHFHAVQGEAGKDVIHACAGVAVVKPTYPFSRAYELADACCKRAKEVTRKKDRSAIDYHILKSGVFSSLKDMRLTHYNGDKIDLKDSNPDQHDDGSGDKKKSIKLSKNPLINRPYVLSTYSKMDDEEVYLVSWNMVKDTAMEIAKWPNSKIKTMREAVLAGKDHFQLFSEQMKRLGYPVPENLHYDGKEGGRPLDCVEFLEAYPSWLLKEEKS